MGLVKTNVGVMQPAAGTPATKGTGEATDGVETGVGLIATGAGAGVEAGAGGAEVEIGAGAMTTGAGSDTWMIPYSAT